MTSNGKCQLIRWMGKKKTRNKPCGQHVLDYLELAPVIIVDTGWFEPWLMACRIMCGSVQDCRL